MVEDEEEEEAERDNDPNEGGAKMAVWKALPLPPLEPKRLGPLPCCEGGVTHQDARVLLRRVMSGVLGGDGRIKLRPEAEETDDKEEDRE